MDEGRWVRDEGRWMRDEGRGKMDDGRKGSEKLDVRGQRRKVKDS